MINDNTEIINSLIKDLSINYRDDRQVLENIYQDMSSIASNVTNRNINDSKLIPYIKTATKSCYLRRGKEGSSSSSEGSESDSFIDIEEKLRNDLIKNGLRRLV